LSERSIRNSWQRCARHERYRDRVGRVNPKTTRCSGLARDPIATCCGSAHPAHPRATHHARPPVHRRAPLANTRGRVVHEPRVGCPRGPSLQVAVRELYGTVVRYRKPPRRSPNVLVENERTRFSGSTAASAPDRTRMFDRARSRVFSDRHHWQVSARRDLFLRRHRAGIGPSLDGSAPIRARNPGQLGSRTGSTASAVPGLGRIHR